MGKTGFKRKSIQYICSLIFICTALALKVQAAEDSGTLPAVSAKVHSEMSDNSDITANLIAGNVFEVLEAVSDAEGGIWYRVKTDFGMEGYVRAGELDLLIMETQALQQAVENTENMELDDAQENALDNDAVENALNDDAQENALDNNAVVSESETAAGELITLDSVNLRSMPSTDSEILRRISQNIPLLYYQRYVNDEGEGWYKVEYEGTTGYVIESAVMLEQEQQPDEEMQVSDMDNVETPISEQDLQESEAVQEKSQSETQTLSNNQAEFQVNEKVQTHKRGGIDVMLIMLIAGGILCIAAIAVFLKKILELLRK